MNQASSFFCSMDPESQRKQALASVYELLLKLAKEKKNIVRLEAHGDKIEKVVPNSEPLKHNIPPEV